MNNQTHILLINIDFFQEGQPPLGIPYLHAYLEANHLRVQSLLITPKPSWKEQLKETIQERPPLLIGIQILTHTRAYAYAAIEIIHKYFPTIQIVLGGIHTSAMPIPLLQKYPFAICVLGEGEQTLLELTQATIRGNSLAKIKGLIFMRKNTVIKTKYREPIPNLDQLPFPKHDLYLKNNSTRAAVLTARGCLHKCSFCSLGHNNTARFRFRSIPNVITELKYIQHHFPKVTEIVIADDAFLTNQNRVDLFCTEVIKHNLRFSFSCFGRFSNISQRIVKKLEQTGFQNIVFGLESANEQILKKAHKNITVKNITHTIQLFAQTNIHIEIRLIVGLPGETNATIKETGLFIQSLQRIKYLTYPKDIIPLAQVFPGTELCQNMKTAKKIDDFFWSTNQTYLPYTVEHSYTELLRMRKELLTYISIDYLFSFKGIWRQSLILLFARPHFKIMKLIYKKNWDKLANTFKCVYGCKT